MRIVTFVFALIAFTLSIAFTGQAAFAGGIKVENAHAMALTDTSKPGAVMMTISNDGAVDNLVSIATPAASMAQIHNAKMKAGKMRMRRTDGFQIPANGSVDLVHDGTHIMLMQLGNPLVPGTSFPLTLTFENAGTVEVMVKVMGG